MKAVEFLRDQRYTEEDQSEGYILNVPELIALLDEFSEFKNKELIEENERLVKMKTKTIDYRDLPVQCTHCGEQFENHLMAQGHRCLISKNQ